jgi:pyruvate dehydrogenase E2 component (dihydrolipoamide acetyltransferase)
MARTMSQAHAEVVAVTVSDDADIDAWAKDEDLTIRLFRAIISGCKAETSLNACTTVMLSVDVFWKKLI